MESTVEASRVKRNRVQYSRACKVEGNAGFEWFECIAK